MADEIIRTGSNNVNVTVHPDGPDYSIEDAVHALCPHPEQVLLCLCCGATSEPDAGGGE